MGVFGDMTDFISRFSNELFGRQNAFDGETPRLQSQRTRNDTKRAVAVRQLGRILAIRPAVAAAAAEPTGESRPLSNFIDFDLSHPTVVIPVTEHRSRGASDTSDALASWSRWI